MFGSANRPNRNQNSWEPFNVFGPHLKCSPNVFFFFFSLYYLKNTARTSIDVVRDPEVIWGCVQ